MAFNFEESVFHQGIFRFQLHRLIHWNGINEGPFEFAIVAKRTSQSKLALLHQAHEIGQMLLYQILRNGRSRVPLFALMDQQQRIFLQRIGRIGFMDALRPDHPRAADFCRQASGFDGWIRVGPFFCLIERISFYDKDAAEHAVIHEWPGNHQFVLFVQLADIGHMRFLQLVAIFLADLWRTGRTLQQDEEKTGCRLAGSRGTLFWAAGRCGCWSHLGRRHTRKERQAPYNRKTGPLHPAQNRYILVHALTPSKIVSILYYPLLWDSLEVPFGATGSRSSRSQRHKDRILL